MFGGNEAVSRKAIENYLDDPLGTEGGRLRPQGPCVPGLGNEPIQVLADVFSHHAAWSPDCTKIAYTGWTERYIGAFYIASVDGSDRVMVFDHGAGSPAWSPDGSKIAFDRGSGQWVKGDPVSHIFVVDADGSNLVQLTSGEFGDRSPSWSPDGKRIVFARQDLNNREGIYERYDDVFIAVMDADGSKLKTLTEGGLSDGYPAWSPDGRWIAYDGGQDLWLMDTEGETSAELPGNTRRMAIRGHLTARRSRIRHLPLCKTTPTATASGTTGPCSSPRSTAGEPLKWSGT